MYYLCLRYCEAVLYGRTNGEATGIDQMEWRMTSNENVGEISVT
jgi:hypothetical protein